MQLMMVLSMLINIVVLVPVCWGIFSDAAWAVGSYGSKSAARDILLSVYVSIGLVSALLLILREPKLAAALLSVQVIYKLTTPFTVGTLDHPVVFSNVAIALFHSVTLYLIWLDW